MLKSVQQLLAAVCLAAQASLAGAATFFIDYSGAEHLNLAEAHGYISFADDMPTNPGAFWLSPGIEVTDFSLTVTGASSGNGIFQLADYLAFSWNTAETTLDLGVELVGQPVGIAGDWGATHDGTTGDFNLIGIENTLAPIGVLAFQIATNGGNGDTLNLTSMRPVPLPAAFWLFGSALASLGFISRKRGPLKSGT